MLVHLSLVPLNMQCWKLTQSTPGMPSNAATNAIFQKMLFLGFSKPQAILRRKRKTATSTMSL